MNIKINCEISGEQYNQKKSRHVIPSKASIEHTNTHIRNTSQSTVPPRQTHPQPRPPTVPPRQTHPQPRPPTVPPRKNKRLIVSV